MAFDFTLIKKHPVASGAAVLVGALVLYMLLKGGSASTASTAQVAPGNDPASLAAMQYNAQQQLQQNAAASQFAQQSLAATTQQNLATIQSYQDITLGTQANQNQALAIQDQLAATQTQAQVQTLQINKAADIQSQAIGAQLAETTLSSTNQTQVQMAGISANEQMQKNQLQASVDQTNTIAALQAHVTDTNAALQQNITQLNTQAQVAITQINANTQQGIANTQASVSKRQSSSNDTATWVGAAVGIASLFCDVKIKTKIECVSVDKCLHAIRNIPLDRFVYIMGSTPHTNGDSCEHVNTYAQDFYRVIDCCDWEYREKIDMVDMMGVMCGAIKALARESA